MNVERDIARFAIPFVSGVLISAFAGASSCSQPSVVFFIALTAAGLACMLILHRSQIGLGPDAVYLILMALICLCGIVTGSRDIVLNISPKISGIHRLASYFGERMQEVIDTIPFGAPENGSLIKAILTGERTSLPHHITEAFRDSGASHILALSGLHLGIIYGILSKTAALSGNGAISKVLRSLLIVCVCGFYTLSTGAGPSIVRAYIFIVIGETIRLTCRYRSLKQIFLASLIIQLIISPLAIRTVSFQLSYLAMAGIVFIFPWLSRLWPEGKIYSRAGVILEKAMKWMWNCAAVSISCQLTTAPLAYLYFDTFPSYFLLTNLLSLPLTGVLIPSAILTVYMSWAGWCPDILIRTTDMLAESLIYSMSVIASI